jgi:aspartyl-tRNA(Asn)/glutamyl-tRNA(Gln) amidotransferase subunit A
VTEALGIAAEVRSGGRRAVEVVEEHLARISASDADIHAFNFVAFESARAAAAAIDSAVARGENLGPLAGVPVALKDNMCTRGTPTTCSSRILEGWVPPYDATVVHRLAAAGAVVIGKTNLDEFAMGSSTENSAFGPTRNPLDTTRVPGGSSGGSAAAVAAGFAPLALGSDTGGSIRQPAALCGVVGAKPTYGVVSRFGLIAFASSLDQIGPFAKSVTDAALLLDAIAGPDPMDSTSLAGDPPPAGARLGAGVEGLRVGVVSELAAAEGISADVVAQTRLAADALSGAGAKVEEVSVPACVYGLSAYYLIAPAEASSNLARYDGVRYGFRATGSEDITEMYMRTRAAGFGPEVKRRIMLGTFALSSGYREAYYLKALKVRRLVKNDFDRAFADCDAIIGPVSPTPAFKIGERADDPLAMYLADIYTIGANLAGIPGISIPCGFTKTGLPIGLQIVAAPFAEEKLLRIARMHEQAADWHKRRPAL